MLGGHLYELIIVLIIALVVFGPKRLPELGSSLGKGIREFRKATNELHDSINTQPAEPLPPERTHYTANEYVAPTQPSAEYVAPQQRSAPPATAEYVAPSVHSAPAQPSESEPPRV